MQNCSFHPVRKCKKFIQWSPFWIIFKGKIKIAYLLPEQSVHRDDHFLQTWPLLSGALDKKFFPFSKSRFWKWGDCQNFKVIGPEEMPILVWGWRKRPQLKLDWPKTYKFWQSPLFHFQLPSTQFQLRKLL